MYIVCYCVYIVHIKHFNLLCIQCVHFEYILCILYNIRGKPVFLFSPPVMSKEHHWMIAPYHTEVWWAAWTHWSYHTGHITLVIWNGLREETKLLVCLWTFYWHKITLFIWKICSFLSAWNIPIFPVIFDEKYNFMVFNLLREKLLYSAHSNS